MKVWICTIEPYHDNSSVEVVYDSEDKARHWIRSKNQGFYWTTRKDVENIYGRGADTWVVERAHTHLHPGIGGHLFQSAGECAEWIKTLEADCALVEDFGVVAMEVQ